MTLYSLTDSQKKYLLNTLFRLGEEKNYLPNEIMYYVDKHTLIYGFIFLKDNTNSYDYRFTIKGLQEVHMDKKTTNEMIDYIRTKKIFPVVSDSDFDSLKDDVNSYC